MTKYVFPREEWFSEFAKTLNESESYADAAKNWEGDFLFIIEPGKELDRELVFYLDLWHGECREAYQVESRETKEAEFMLIGPYKNWKKLISGKMNATRALMGRKLKVKGSMAKLMKNTRAAAELTKAAQQVPTEFM